MFSERITERDRAKLDEARVRARGYFEHLMNISTLDLSTDIIAEIAARGAARGEGIKSEELLPYITKWLLETQGLDLP
jgi:hypothetical protein